MTVDNPNVIVKGPDQRKNDIICFRCKEKGHVAYECKIVGKIWSWIILAW
jgi:hypothetical protein